LHVPVALDGNVMSYNVKDNQKIIAKSEDDQYVASKNTDKILENIIDNLSDQYRADLKSINTDCMCEWDFNDDH
jgi:hypothetical protein